MSNPHFVLALTPLYRLLLAALSGALLSLAFPCHPDHPLAFLYHPLWAHCALVPLLLALQGRGFKAGFAAGWISGFVWNLLSLYWVAYTQGGGPAVVGGTGLMAAYLGLFIWFLHWAIQRARCAMGREGARTAAFVVDRAGIFALPWGTGFPLALARDTAKRPCPTSSSTPPGPASLASPVGSSASTRCFTWRSSSGASCSRALPWAISCLGFTLRARWRQPSPTEGLRIGLIQPNTTYIDKWGPNGLERTFSALATLSRQAAKRDPELLVWPETAVPCDPIRRAGCRRPHPSARRGVGHPLADRRAARELQRGLLRPARGHHSALVRQDALGALWRADALPRRHPPAARHRLDPPDRRPRPGRIRARHRARGFCPSPASLCRAHLLSSPSFPI